VKPVIILMPDYECHPLWWRGDHEPGEIDPSSLPLSKDTVRDLNAWARTFDSWLDPDDPAGGPEPPPEAVSAFEAEGVRLWKALRRELGDAYSVLYRNVKGRVLEDPRELDA